MLEYERFMRRDVYDLAAKAGVLASNKGTRSAQINNLILTFQSLSDPIDATLFLLIYVARQSGRREIPFDVGRRIMEDVKAIYDSFGREPEKLRAAIIKYLTLLKWFYESNVRGRVSNFTEFLSKIVGGGR